MFVCLIKIIESKTAIIQALFIFCGILVVAGWFQWCHFVYSLIVKEKILSNKNTKIQAQKKPKIFLFFALLSHCFMHYKYQCH